MQTVAFDTAAEAFAQALSLLDRDDERARAEVLLELARAELRAGATEGGRAHIEESARLWSRLGDAEGYARAALERGAILRFAHVDPQLVAMLRTANERLGDRPRAEKARVLARLAAASQPSPEPELAFEMALEAIEMARALDDPQLLLDVLYTASSAFVDLVEARERRPVDEAHAQLAERLNDPVHALRAHTRLMFDCFDLGDFDGARAALRAVEQHAATLAHPLFGWIPLALANTFALYEGRVETARALVGKLEALSPGHPDPNLAMALGFQRARLARLAGDPATHRRAVRDIEAQLHGPDVGPLRRTVAASELVYAAPEAAEVELRPEDAEAMLRLGDRTTLAPLVQLAFCREDHGLCERAAALLEASHHSHGGGGVMSMVWDGPLGTARALALSAQGQLSRAHAAFEEALQRALREEAHPAAARTLLWWLRATARHGDLRRPPVGLRQGLSSLEQLRAEPEVVRRARELAASIEGRSGAAGRGSPAGVSSAPSFELRPDGEHFRLRVGEQTFALKATKGVRWLAQLVERPGEPVHVLTLSSGGKAPREADLGDAGEVLDERAVHAYRARLRELAAELEQAQGCNDLGRVDAISEEREALLHELSGAIGLGDRPRRDKGAVERARVNVQRRLKDAISRAAELHPGLGKHLQRCVRTGVVCVYDPE